MIDAVILVLFIVLIAVIAKAATSRGRHTKMTEEEFNKEADRVTMRGAGVAEFQRIVDPSHKVEYLQQRDKHVEAEETDSGDKPSAKGTSGRERERPSDQKNTD